MASEAEKALARRYFKAYEHGDVDAVMKFIAPNYTLYPGGGARPMSADERKQDEAAFFSAFSDIKVAVEDQIAEGQKVANRVTMHCTHTGEYQGVPATGKRVTITYMDIARVKAGKITEEWVEFDLMSILKQINPGKERHPQHVTTTKGNAVTKPSERTLGRLVEGSLPGRTDASESSAHE